MRQHRLHSALKAIASASTAFGVLMGSTLLAGAQAKSLPAIETADLNGTIRNFPAGLPSNPTLLIAAFDRVQQDEVDRMFGLMAEAGLAKTGLSALEIPVIENPGFIGRVFIDNGMRGGIPSTQTRSIVFTLYVPSLANWLASTGIPSTNDVHVLAVARDGRILKSASASVLRDTAAMRGFLKSIRKK
jgi:hypothetical protein